MPSRAPLLFGMLLLAGRSAAAQPACDGRPISTVHVTTVSLFAIEDQAFPGFLQRLGNALHWTTRASTVRRELLFAEGEPCDVRRLEETERLLRAQAYIRAAEITSHQAEDGGAAVTVVTRDDWSIRGSGRFETGGDRGPVRRLRLAEENLWGRGIRAQIRYTNEGREPGFDVGVSSNRLVGRYDGSVVLGNSSVGPLAEQTLLRPFESEFDRVAWREALRYRKEPFLFTSRALGGVIQPVVTTGGEIGAGARFGRPGRLLVVGSVLSFERLFIEGSAFGRDAALDSAAAAGVMGRYTERRRVRAHVMLGARSLRFSPRRGVDAVNAEEDIRLGFEGGIVAGKSLFNGDGLQRDWFGAAEFYAGATRGPRELLFARAKVEGRLLAATRTWDGVIAAGEVLLYHARGPGNVVVASVSGAGGWRVRTPFQLTLGGPFGLRGYGTAMPGAQRVALHVEERRFRGVAFGAVDVGTALFVDAGQGWDGTVPFGENTGMVGAVGAGLRLAFPSGSRLTYRLDVALPLRGGHGLEIRTGFRQQFGIVRGESDDVVRSREQVSSVTVFNFPRF